MKKTIMKLIEKYNELGLVLPVVFMHQKGDVKQIRKEMIRASVIWDCRDRSGNYDDVYAQQLIKAEKKTTATLLYKTTKKILIAKKKESELISDIQEPAFMKDHENMFEWSIGKLLDLGIITPFLRSYYSDFMDNEGVTIGVKQISETDVQPDDSPELEEPEP